VVIPADVLPALELLKAQGFLLIGATNQPDVARGKTPKQTVIDINTYLSQTLPLDDMRVCYHDDSDACHCRKPLPGLLLDAAKDYQIDLQKSFMIGDRYKDVEAGLHARCQTIWLRQDYLEKNPSSPPHFIASTFQEGALWILKTLNKEFHA
jgi:D-glycero-D-manno-heptose 1,7-bisphosphate phosphatase